MGKIFNGIVYIFSPKRSLDLLFALPLPDIYVAWTNIADAISFVLENQKAHYKQKHKFFFIKVGDWAMLRLHKSYSIISYIKVTKKLTKQYVSLFRIKEKVERLAYRLEVPDD